MSSPRSNIVLALLTALALHAALGIALALYLTHAPAPDELAKLDLTSVDLSFAETIEETAATVTSAPSPPVDAHPLPRPADEPQPPPRRAPASGAQPATAEILSPHLDEAILPTPVEPIKKMTIEPKHEVERREARDEKPRETQDEKPQETQDEKPLETRDEKPQPPRDASPAMAASAPRQARVDAPPKPRRAIRPDYPRESRLRGEHGDVALELDVASDGSVSAVRILRSPGYPLLDEAAVKAARAARFTPAKSGGQPVASTVRLTLNFRLK